MLKIAGIVVVVLLIVVAGILIYAATKPNDFRVERRLAIKAPAEKIYAQIADLKGWQAWSPYEKKDPAMKRTLSGAPHFTTTQRCCSAPSKRGPWRRSRRAP